MTLTVTQCLADSTCFVTEHPWLSLGALAILTLALVIIVILSTSTNTRRIARFEKISYEVFREDYLANVNQYADDEEIREIYDGIRLPERSSTGSAGYDIYAPYNLNVNFGAAAVIPTGLRCRIDKAWDLEIVPRSGHGFKYGIRLANTIGVIDSDYYTSDRGGHIMIKLVNDDPAVNMTRKAFEVEGGKGFAQGLFRPYGLTVDDAAYGRRRGGFGSSDQKSGKEKK